MADQIQFSVVMPAFNAERTIVASLTSCLAQTKPPFEIIVVDDGSTDRTKELVEKTFSENVRLISLSENRGPAAARNIGIRAATGTHIAFQDADDTWHLKKLEHVAEVLAKHPEISFLFHPYTLAAVEFIVTPQMLRPEKYSFWKLLLSNPIGTPCVIISRKNMPHFKENMWHMEDYELFLRTANRQGVYRISAPFTKLGRPILSSGGHSAVRWKMRMGELRAWWSFARFRPAFLPVILPLTLFSLLKHAVKSFFPPRTNY